MVLFSHTKEKNMTHKELLERFLLFEKENDLLKWKVDEIPIWQLIRIAVFTELKDKLLNKNIEFNQQKLKDRVKVVTHFFINFITKNPFIKVKRSEILIFNHPRRKLNKGFFEDIYIDPILNVIKNEFIVLEGFVSLDKDHYKPTKTKNLYYLDVLQLPSRIVSEIPIKVRLNKDDKLKILKIENDIYSIWHTNIFDIEKKAIKNIRRWRYTYPRINKMIKKIQPRMVFNVVSYSFLNQVATYTAKKQGIPVLELQHGTVGKLHIAYNYLTLEEGTLDTFPDFFLAWGKNWIKNARLPIKKENIKIVGFLYYESYRSKIISERNNKTLLFLSQYREDIAKFAAEVASKLPEYKIIFKAHPSEYEIAKIKYPFFANYANIQLVDNDSIQLYELFSQCNFVIGVNSTALAEALAFCPSIVILKLPGWEYFEDLEESDNLRFLSNTNEVVTLIKNNALKENNTNISGYFIDNSKTKIKDLIDSI